MTTELEQTTQLAVVLPEEVQAIALSVSEEKRAEVTNTLNQIFTGTADWKAQVEAIVVKDPSDKLGMNLAKTARLNAKNARLAAEKLFDQKRDEVQAQMLSYQTEDKLWLKAKQTMIILFKEIEQAAEYKEKTEERYEAEQYELKIQTRLTKLAAIDPEITRKEIEGMSDLSFDAFLAGIIAQKAEADRLAKAEAERQRQIALRKERDDNRFKIFAGTGLIFADGIFAKNENISYNFSELCELNDDDFVVKVQEAIDKIAECKAAEIKEKERLAAIAKAKEKELEEERKKAETERKNREEKEKKEREEKDARFEVRKKIMIDMGFKYDPYTEYNFSLKDVWSCFQEQIYNPDDKEFDSYMSGIKDAIKRNTEKKRQDEIIAKQKAEIEAKNKKELEAKQAEEKRVAAEKAEADRLAKAPKKEKLTKWIDDLALTAPEGLDKDAVVVDILAKFAGFKKWAKGEVDKL